MYSYIQIKQVARLCADGLTKNQIAEKVNLSLQDIDMIMLLPQTKEWMHEAAKEIEQERLEKRALSKIEQILETGNNKEILDAAAILFKVNGKHI